MVESAEVERSSRRGRRRISTRRSRGIIAKRSS